jgi:hypothetical protein
MHTPEGQWLLLAWSLRLDELSQNGDHQMMFTLAQPLAGTLEFSARGDSSPGQQILIGGLPEVVKGNSHIFVGGVRLPKTQQKPRGE